MLVWLLVLAMMMSTFDFLPNWDDDMQILQNPYVLNGAWGSLKVLFTEPVAGMYQPLVSAFFMVEAELFGAEAYTFHFFSLIWHLFAVSGFYFWMHSLLQDKGISAALALLFLFYPAAVEPVAWISARSTLMYAGFGFWALYFWVGYLKSGRQNLFVYAFLLVLLAMFSKVQGILFPIAMLILWFLIPHPSKPGFFKALLFLLPIPLFLYLGLRFRPDTGESLSILGLLEQSGPKFLWYLKRLVYFADSAAVYPPLSTGLLGYGGLLMMLLLMVFAGLLWRKRDLKAFALLFYFMFTSIHFIQFSTANPVADRYAYVPFAGILLFMGLFVQTMGKPLRRLLFGFTLMYFASQFFWLLPAWKNPTSLWNHAVVQYSSFYFPWEKKANTYAAKAQWDAAIEAYEKALTLDSGKDRLFYNAALAYFQLGKREQAKAYYREAIALNPEVFYYFINLARLLFEEGETEEAGKLLLESYRLAPENGQVNLTLAQFAMETGQWDPCPYLQKALALGEKIPAGVFKNYCE